MTCDWRTLDGPKPEYATEFGMVSLPSSKYKDRTRKNVETSGATLRIAQDFKSPGELCTLKAIYDFGKPYYDVLVPSEQGVPVLESFYGAVNFIIAHRVRVLNVAGNSETTVPGIYDWSREFLVGLFLEVQRRTEIMYVQGLL